MADKRPAGQKPKGSGNPNRINRLLEKKAQTEFEGLSNVMVLTNIGINSEQNAEIRADLRGKKVKFTMVRNRLAQKALSELGLKDSASLFQGPTCIVRSEDPVAAAKTALDLVGKYEKSIKLVGGLLEGKVLNLAEVKSLSKSKSKPELLGEVVALAKGPGGRIAGALKGPGSKIAGALKALVEKLEKAAAPVAEAAAAVVEAAPAAAGN